MIFVKKRATDVPMAEATEIPAGRAMLARLVRGAGDIVRIDDAVELLGLERIDASKLLARWAKQGWLKRIAAGVYLPVPVNALESQHVLDDPWILVPALFSPAYISGFSAAEYWDLTEQIFRDVVVMTAAPLRARKKTIHGVCFVLRRMDEKKFFGTRNVWRGQSKVLVADPHRAIIDMLSEPKIGGGIQHIADCFTQYLLREDRDDEELVEYARLLGNGAVLKRLGFLAERLGADLLAKLCSKNLSAGNIKLDPNLKCPRLITRWKLFVPESLAEKRS